MAFTAILHEEIKQLIVESLNLELEPSSLDGDKPLFGETGLGLDSIDALELATVVAQKYGCQLKSGDGDNAKIFYNIASLTAFINQHRSK